MATEYKSFYATAGGEEGSRCVYPTRLDTYGCGCQHDCRYCYARSLLDFRGLWHPADPSVADIAKVRKKVSTLTPGSVVRMGGMTDFFAPVETLHGVTYETIKALNERGVHQLIVTKSPLVATDKYMDVLDPRLAHIQLKALPAPTTRRPPSTRTRRDRPSASTQSSGYRTPGSTSSSDYLRTSRRTWTSTYLHHAG